MKKPSILALWAGIALIALAGCREPSFSQPTVHDNPPSSSSEVSLSVKEGSLSDQGLTLLIANSTGREFTYGMEYTVEQYRDGAWYAMGGERIVPDIAAVLMPQDTNEFSVTWEAALPEGTYRVVKPVCTSQGIQDLAAQFTVE